MGLLMAACAPSAEHIASQTAGAQTATAASWTETPTATITLTSTNTPTITPTPTSTPTPPPIQARGWEAARLSAVCLEIKQTYTNVEGEFTLPIERNASSALGRMGIQVTALGDQCDATLTIEITAQALGATYGTLGRCYSGASATSRATLSAEGYNPLITAPYSMTEPVYFLMFSQYCEREPRGAPFRIPVTTALLGNLLQIWGRSVLYAGLEDSDGMVRMSVVHAVQEPEARAAGLQKSAIMSILILALQDDTCSTTSEAARALKAFGAASRDAVPTLVQILLSPAHDTCNDKGDVIEALGGIGPAAREAVPALIEALRSGDPMLVEYAPDALRRITGQNFGVDADAWQEWWDSQD